MVFIQVVVLQKIPMMFLFRPCAQSGTIEYLLWNRSFFILNNGQIKVAGTDKSPADLILRSSFGLIYLVFSVMVVLEKCKQKVAEARRVRPDSRATPSSATAMAAYSYFWTSLKTLGLPQIPSLYLKASIWWRAVKIQLYLKSSSWHNSPIYNECQTH